MKAKAIVAGVFVAAACTSALAQDMTRDQLNQRPRAVQQNQQGVSPSARSDHSSMGGAPAGTSGSGTLMQQREQGMSPDGTHAPAQNSHSTGVIKQ